MQWTLRKCAFDNLVSGHPFGLQTSHVGGCASWEHAASRAFAADGLPEPALEVALGGRAHCCRVDDFPSRSVNLSQPLGASALYNVSLSVALSEPLVSPVASTVAWHALFNVVITHARKLERSDSFRSPNYDTRGSNVWRARRQNGAPLLFLAISQEN